MAAPRTLAELGIGESAVLLGFLGSQSATQRLQEMGLTEGERISLAAVAPLGDPMEFLVRGYHLSIRKSDAELVSVGE